MDEEEVGGGRSAARIIAPLGDAETAPVVRTKGESAERTRGIGAGLLLFKLGCDQQTHL